MGIVRLMVARVAVYVGFAVAALVGFGYAALSMSVGDTNGQAAGIIVGGMFALLWLAVVLTRESSKSTRRRAARRY